MNRLTNKRALLFVLIVVLVALFAFVLSACGDWTLPSTTTENGAEQTSENKAEESASSETPAQNEADKQEGTGNQGGNTSSEHIHTYGRLIGEVPATCEGSGFYAHYVCAECGLYFDKKKVQKEESDLVIPPKGHTEKAVAAVEAGCVTTGKAAHTECTVCHKLFVLKNGVKTEVAADALVLAAKGHTEITDAAVPATCLSYGWTEGKRCAVCGEVLVTPSRLSRSEHTYGALIPETPATCTEAGQSAHYQCSVCDKLFDENKAEVTASDLLLPAGHVYGNLTPEIPVTCEADGRIAFYQCSVCEEYFNQNKEIVAFADLTIASVGHVYGDLIPETPAACEEAGCHAHYQCSVCKTNFDEQKAVVERDDVVVPATGHTEVVDEAVEPTCTKTGLTEGKHCSVCNNVLLAQEVLPTTEHTYGDLIPATPATCDSQGNVAYYECSVCHNLFDQNKEWIAAEDVVIPYGHDYGDWVAESPATCTEDGTRGYYHCAKCGGYFDEDKQALLSLVIPATGHTEAIDEAVSATCEEGGLTQGKHCSVCGVTLVDREATSPLGHAYGDLIPAIPATCTEDGKAAYYECSVCHKLFDEDKAAVTAGQLVISAEGHAYGSIVAALDPGCETAGNVAHYQCSVCHKYFDQTKHEIAAEDVVIAATGHTVVVDPAAPATCQNTGLTEGSHCSVCHKTLVAQEIVPIADHAYGDLIGEVSATCTADGVAAHYECSVCHRIFNTDKQQVTQESLSIPAGHTYGNLIEEVPATTEKDGMLAHYECSVCHKFFDQNKVEVTESSLVIPSAPVLSVSGEYVVWEVSDGIDYYEVSVDDDDDWIKYEKSFAVGFSDTSGDHTIAVRGVRGETETATAVFSYRTASPTLGGIATSGLTATWQGTGKSITLTVNGEAAEYAYSDGTYSYVCPQVSGDYDLTVTVTSGYADHVYYVGSTLTDSATITVNALASPVVRVTQLNEITWNSISHAHHYMIKEDDSDWSECEGVDHIALKTGVGQHKFYVQAISTGGTYLSSAIVEFGYETRALALSDLSVTGRKVSFTVSAPESAVTVYKDDVSQGTLSDCSDLTHPSAYVYAGVPRTLGSYTVRVDAYPAYAAGVYYYALTDITKSATVTVAKLGTPVLQKAANGITWSAVTGASGYTSETGSLGNVTSLAYSTATGAHSLRVKALASDDSAYVDGDFSDQVGYYTAAVTLSEVTFKGLTASWTANAKTVEVKEGSGSYAATTLCSRTLTSLSAGTKTVSVKATGGYDAEKGIYYYGSAEKSRSKTIEQAATNLTFDDGTEGAAYVSDAWTQYNHGTGATVTGQMYAKKDGNGNKIVNMVAGKNTLRYVYHPTGGIGVANYLSLRAGNYWTDAKTILYKILLKDTSGVFHFMAGTPNSSATIQKTSYDDKVLSDLCYAFFDPIEVAEVWFLLYADNDEGKYSYFYVDDVYLCYKDPLSGSNLSYTKDFADQKFVNHGASDTVTLPTAGDANTALFYLENKSSGHATVTVSLLGSTVNGKAALVAQGTFLMEPNQSYTNYRIIFAKAKVKSYKIEVVTTSGDASVNVKNVKIEYAAVYQNNAAKLSAYTVPQDTSPARSVKLFGKELVGTSNLILYKEEVTRLGAFAGDVSPLFSYIGGGMTILSATYSSNKIHLAYVYDQTYYSAEITVEQTTGNDLKVNNQKDNVNYKVAADSTFTYNVGAHGVLFGGSSSMEKWVTFGQDMKDYPAADVGIGGTRTVDWISSGDGACLAERLIFPLNPSVIVLFIGVNDLKEGATPAATYANLQTLFTQIHTALPHAKILYTLINYVPNTDVKADYVTTLNGNVTDYAAGLDYLDVVQIDGVINNGYSANKPYQSSFSDTMHLNAAGYTRWAYCVRKKVMETIG